MLSFAPIPEKTLVELLELKAVEEGLTNVAFCRGIGMDHGQWSRVRRGQEALGILNCRRIMEHYPDLTEAVLRYVADYPNQDDAASTAPDHTEDRMTPR